MARAAPNAGDPAVQRAALAMQGWYAGAVTQAELLRCLLEARARAPESGGRLDELLLGELEQMRHGLLEAREMIADAQKLLDQYSAAPLIPALFLDLAPTRLGDMAIVANGGGQRVVALDKEVEAGSLRAGAPVYLSADQSVLVAVAAAGQPQPGEMAVFERYMTDGRIVLKPGHEEQVVVMPAASLDDTALRPGDVVRWDRAARLCLEKIEDAARNPFRLEQVEDIPLERIGGQKANLRRLREALLSSLLYPDRMRRYRLPGSNTLLLYGPPGNGKTYMTRVLFSEIQRLSGKKVFLAVVKGAQWESPWVGQTQMNITALFASLREAAAEGHFAALFLDEIEAVGRIRGSLSGHHSDKALSTLLNELNGFQELQGVSVIGACNRKDLLDAALLSRFGDEIPVHRPDLQAAQEIFAVHLEPDLPYAHGESQAEQTRQEMIQLAVSRLYAPNGDGDICVLKLRDGRTRPVAARELVSGRLILQISRAVKRRGLQREIETGDASLQVEDMRDALVETRERLTDTLTAYNVHNHLETLAEDEVVLAVEPVRRRVARPYHYIHAA
ncbi:MAG TPA: AAA family ATPase [Chthonomonadaceae bacterium]|nr:AAA family ATPase [Chthonomonadaceae bacterium]